MAEPLSPDDPDEADGNTAPPPPPRPVPPIRFRDDPAPLDAPAPLAAFLAGANTAAVRLDGGEDARLLLPHLGRLALVEVAFASFRDGRGYSAARILREAGYRGELRAAGDVLIDQVALMRRSGFDSLLPDRPLDPAAVDRALSRYPFVYQKAADARAPAWALRHG